MQRIRIELGQRGYGVAIGGGLLTQAGQLLAPFCPHARAFIVTDENVAQHWLPALSETLGETGIAGEPIVLPPGETTKSWTQLEKLVDRLLGLGIGRDDPVIALGGGVIGDIAGFAAAIVKRGCGLVQVPTTLLAMVDSSVGGKTAINSRRGKNTVGTFHQPDFALVDPDMLATLPDRELRAGHAETVKYGLIEDSRFFGWCEENVERLLARDPDTLSEAISYCVAAKARVVGADEEDRHGRRALLNLGHTFAHALEAEARPAGALLHGEAVAIGIVLAFAFSAQQGLCPKADAERVAAHLAEAGLPTALPADAGADRLLAHMRSDKKALGNSLTLVLARGIGGAFLAEKVSAEHLLEFLEAQSKYTKSSADTTRGRGRNCAPQSSPIGRE